MVKWSNPGHGVSPPQHFGVVAIEKRVFWSPLTKVANFTFTYRLELPGILLIRLFAFSLIIHWAPIITCAVVVLEYYIYSIISISRSLYLLILLCSSTDMLLSVDMDISIRRYVFSFIVLKHYILSITLIFLILFGYYYHYYYCYYPYYDYYYYLILKSFSHRR